MSNLHNALRRAGAIQAAIPEALGVQDGQVLIERLSETMTPTLDIWSLPEWKLLRGEHMGWGNIDLGAGGAGTRSIVGIRNDSTIDEPWIVVVEDAQATAAAPSTDIRIAISFTDIGGDATFFAREGRMRTGPPHARKRSDNSAALPAGISAGLVAIGMEGNSGLFIRLLRPVVLRFGQGLYFFGNADQASVSLRSAYFHSRRLLPGEITGSAP